MSLNPVQFGAEVIDQFGRFLMTSFPIADPDMEAQVREHLRLFDHCLRLRDQNAAEGVVALLVYPMNALADDQLRRLRRLLAGTRIPFGRYTGVTPEEGDPEQGRMAHSRAYTPAEQKLLDAGREEDVPIPREECFSRRSILERRPRILLTNYSQLEYLLLRDKDLAVFRDAPLRFLVMDDFVQGYQGLACSLEPDGRPRVTFDGSAGHDASGARLFPLVLCRSCGQHYLKLVAEEPVAMNGVGVRTTRSPDDRHEMEDGEGTVYLTNRLVGHDEDQDQERVGWLCRVCGALHDAPSDRCGNASCAMAGTLVRVIVHEGDMKTCLACSTAAKGYEEIVTAARSSEVADVNILAQSMLAAMPEESFQKLLIFTDNRQDAAFQAGWMEERSRRYRLRHLLFSTLEREPDHVWSLEKLTERLVDLAKDHGIIAHGAWDLEEDNVTRVRWFLLQEFASTATTSCSTGTARSSYWWTWAWRLPRSTTSSPSCCRTNPILTRPTATPRPTSPRCP
jgi:hypothetical protein